MILQSTYVDKDVSVFSYGHFVCTVVECGKVSILTANDLVCVFKDMDSLFTINAILTGSAVKIKDIKMIDDGLLTVDTSKGTFKIKLAHVTSRHIAIKVEDITFIITNRNTEVLSEILKGIIYYEASK